MRWFRRSDRVSRLWLRQQDRAETTHGWTDGPVMWLKSEGLKRLKAQVRRNVQRLRERRRITERIFETE